MLQAGRAGDCQLLSAVSQGHLASPSLPGKEGDRGWAAVLGHSPALGEQGPKGVRVFEGDPAELYCLKPSLLSRLLSKVDVTCAPEQSCHLQPREQTNLSICVCNLHCSIKDGVRQKTCVSDLKI